MLHAPLASVSLRGERPRYGDVPWGHVVSRRGRSRAGARRILGITVSAEVATALWYATTWIILQLLTAVAFNTGEGGIAIWSHIGGFIVGLIFAQPFVRRAR